MLYKYELTKLFVCILIVITQITNLRLTYLIDRKQYNIALVIVQSLVHNPIQDTNIRTQLLNTIWNVMYVNLHNYSTL